MLTREQFLKRCETAYDAGLITQTTIPLLERWLDFVMRFEGGQTNYVVDFLESEAQRTHRFNLSLANDYDGRVVVAKMKEGGRAFPAGASGPFGEDVPGDWLSHADMMAHYSSTVRDAEGTRLAPRTHWWDIHCTNLKNARAA